MSNQEKETVALRYPEHISYFNKVKLNDTLNGQISGMPREAVPNLGLAFERTAARILRGIRPEDEIQGFTITQDEEDRSHFSFTYQRPNYMQNENPEIFEAAGVYYDGPVISGEVRVSHDWDEIVLYEVSVIDA